MIIRKLNKQGKKKGMKKITYRGMSRGETTGLQGGLQLKRLAVYKIGSEWLRELPHCS